MNISKSIVTFILFGLVIFFVSPAQTSQQPGQEAVLDYSGHTLIYLGMDGDTLSTMEFNSEIKYLIKLSDTQISVQTIKSSNLISILSNRLVLSESITPKLESDESDWFLLFNENKQFLLEYAEVTFRLEYHKSRSTKVKPVRIWHPLEATTNSTSHRLKNFIFDMENQRLFFSFPKTQSFVSVSFKSDSVQTNYVQNQNSVPKACCASWFYDDVKKQVVLFIKNGSKRNEYHAFAFKNGIPQADKKVGNSYYHTKDWYELGLYRGKFDSLPDQIMGDALFKDGSKYAQLESRQTH